MIFLRPCCFKIVCSLDPLSTLYSADHKSPNGLVWKRWPYAPHTTSRAHQETLNVKPYAHETTIQLHGASLVAQTVKRLPAMRETQVQSLGQEDPMEKEMATHSSTLAWKIPWAEKPGKLQSMGSQRVRHDWATSLHFLNFEVISLPYSSVFFDKWMEKDHIFKMINLQINHVGSKTSEWIGYR